MNSRMIRRTVRATLVVAAAAAFSACQSDEVTPLAGNPAGADLAIGLDVSSSRAPVGGQVAVAVHAVSGEKLGVLQGHVTYDPAALKFVGQVAEGRTLVMVGTDAARSGDLHVLSLNVETGLAERTGTLVFEVLKPGYTGGLKYVYETAGDQKATRAYAHATLAGGVLEAADLVVPAGARPMALADWNRTLWPAEYAASQAPRANIAGQYLLNLRYGNADLSVEPAAGGTSCPVSSVNGLDASYVANAAVSNINVLRDTVIGGTTRPRDGVVAANVFPNSSPIPGVEGNGTRRIDGLDAAAIANAAVGNQRPPVCSNIPGRGALPSLRDSVTSNITSNTTWDATQVHVVDGFIRVIAPAVLTIQPGTRIEGNSANNPSGLLIERGAQIQAVGTPLEPIVFSCNAAVKTKGCWAGLVLAGRAPINSNQGATTATSPDGGCLETPFEGVSGTAFDFSFGGCTSNDNSGTLKYVRVEYGGFVFTANKELNNLTLAGIGDGTTIDFVQAHAGKDDGLELFGGTVNIKHYIGTANQDDSYDYASGWTGNAQFLIIQHDSIDSDKGFEIDNTEAAATYTDDTPCAPSGSGVCTTIPARPRTRGQIYNVTMIGTASYANTIAAGSGNPCSGAGKNTSVPRFTGGDVSCGAIHLRRGARPTISNIVAEGWRYLIDLDDDATSDGVDFTQVLKLGPINWNAVFRLDEPDAETAAFAPYFTAGDPSIEDNYLTDAVRNPSNSASATEMLRDPFNVMYPDFRPVSSAAVANGATPPSNGFFDVTATYKGAVAPDGFGIASIPWYSGWTRPWTDAANP